jgi:hypothetical protein
LCLFSFSSIDSLPTSRIGGSTNKTKQRKEIKLEKTTSTKRSTTKAQAPPEKEKPGKSFCLQLSLSSSSESPVSIPSSARKPSMSKVAKEVRTEKSPAPKKDLSSHSYEKPTSSLVSLSSKKATGTPPC